MSQTAPRQRVGIVGLVLMTLLCAACVALAFQAGAYSPGDWLPLLVGVAALAVILITTGPPVSWNRLQKITLGFFGAQVVWTTASILWASSTGNAWEEINRTLLYAVVIAIVFVGVRWAGSTGLNALSILLVGAVGIVALVIVIRLGVGSDPALLFSGGRLNYPVTYWNGLAALLMIGFWLALGMANAGGGADTTRGVGWKSRQRQRRRPNQGRLPLWSQPMLLCLSVLFAELALLPQSRGAFWTFFLIVPFYVVLSPHRFRALVDLAIVALAVGLSWGRINGVYVALRDGASNEALSHGLEALAFSILIVLATWAASVLVERWVGPLPRRLVFWIGVGLAALVLLGAIGGLVYADQRTKGLNGYLHDRWSELTSDQGTSGDRESRFTEVGLNGRLTQWKVAGKAFLERPVFGLGAQNFEPYYYEHRTTSLDVRQPHSQPVQLLAELGFPGLVLWLGFVSLTLVRGIMVRFRATSRVNQAVIGAVLTAVLSWFVHSSVDWLWQLAAVTLPAVMLLGGLSATTDSRSLSPRLVMPAGPAPEEELSGRTGVKRSRLIRGTGALLALLVIASAALPYLSLRYCASAAAIGTRALDLAVARTETAFRLDPMSTLPPQTRARLFEAAAQQTPLSSRLRVERLQFAAHAWVQATRVDPSDWLLFYKAAAAYLALKNAAVAAGDEPAARFTETARTYLAEAKRLNPLSGGISTLEEALNGRPAPD